MGNDGDAADEQKSEARAFRTDPDIFCEIHFPFVADEIEKAEKKTPFLAA